MTEQPFNRLRAVDLPEALSISRQLRDNLASVLEQDAPDVLAMIGVLALAVFDLEALVRGLPPLGE